MNASNPITQINSEFWNSRNIVLPDSDEKLYGGIIESPFFADLSALGIGQNEWSCLDPQQRLCLSLAQELTTELTLPQNTSVFIGLFQGCRYDYDYDHDHDGDEITIVGIDA